MFRWANVMIILTLFLIENVSSSHLVKRKQQLRVPLLVPIKGSINPLGDICTKSAEIAVKRINEQEKVLPNYDLVVDIIDDQCNKSKSLGIMMEELLDWKWRQVDSNGGEIFTPPLLMGSPCSSVTRSVGALVQHFGVIQATVGGVDSELNDPNSYPNFYRLFRSSSEIALLRVELSLSMGWNQVALLSDLRHFSYRDSYLLMQLLVQHNITIQAEEFLIDQEKVEDVVGRLKAKDARIIFAICYISNCPAIACAAYKIGLYGPTVVWIFNSAVDILKESAARPEGCTKEMTDAFAEGSLFVGNDATGNIFDRSYQSEVGLSAGDITDYIVSHNPKLKDKSAFGWRLLCFELAHNAAFILHNVEQSLVNESIVDLIKDKNRRTNDLTERLRQSVLSLNIKSSWGPGRWQSTNFTPWQRYSYATPALYVEQVRKTIYFYLFIFLVFNLSIEKHNFRLNI